MRAFRNAWLTRVVTALSVALAFPAYTYAATVTGSVTAGVTLNAVTTLTTGSTSTVAVRLPSAYSPVSFTSGSGALAVSKMWTNTISLATSTPQTLDLTALSGGAGDTSLASVKIFAIYNNETTASKKVTVGNAASTQFKGPLSSGTTTIDIDGGAAMVLFSSTAAGWTTSSLNNLKLDPGSNAVSVTVVLAGN